MTPKAMVQARIWHARCRRGKYGYGVLIGGAYTGTGITSVRWLSGTNAAPSARKAWEEALRNLLAEELTR